MAGILQALSGLVGLVSLAASIILLIQLFKAKGPMHGIAGFCCFIYLIIWGFQNADTLDASNPPVLLKYKQWVLVLVIAIVVNIVLNGITMSMMAAAAR